MKNKFSCTFIKSFCLIVLLAIIVPIVNLKAQGNLSIKGVVKDENGIVLQAATVFIDGYDMVAMTDTNGDYFINNIKPGAYKVAVSMIGRVAETQIIAISKKSAVVNFILKTKSIALKEVTIGTDSRRPELLKIFYEHFLGRTDNALSCKVLNPQIIEFTTNKNDIFATTDDFLVIENKNLGYKIKYRLKIFRYNKPLNTTSYTGDCVFQELQGTDREKIEWAKNRNEAYKGSFMHYLRSLYAGNSVQEGFNTFAFIDNAPTPTVSDELVNMNQYVNPIDSNLVKLSFRKKFRVIYGKNRAIAIKHGERSSLKEARKILMGYVEDKKIGVVNMFLDYTIMDRNGSYMDYRSFLLGGIWNTLQVGDRLPYTYEP